MKRFLLSLAALLLLATAAAAQGCGPSNPNCIVPDRPDGDSTNSAADTRFVQRAITLVTNSVVSVTGNTSLDSTKCGARYSLGGLSLYTLTVPAASGFAVGCSYTISNDDPFPTYTSTMFTGTISGTTLTAVGSGPTALGQTLAGPVGTITSGTTVTACPGGVCGGAGAYTISNSITLAGASFTGTAAASPHGKQLTVSAVTGTIHIGDTLAGTGVSAGTTILRQWSGTPGGAGVYLISAQATSSGASLTTTPTLGSYATGGGRGKFISGLSAVSILYPGQSITITSLGSSWQQPTIVPRWQMPQSTSLRIFISATGNDSTGDGLGGCGTGGAPFATLQNSTNWLGQNIDLRNIDPFTIQMCPASYVAGTQETHFPTDIPGRNGGAGIRITGSPLGLQQCIDSTAATLTSAGPTVIDSQLPYVWLQVDCMTINPTNGAAVFPARGSWTLMSTGLIIGPGSGGGGQQIGAGNGGHLLLDTATTLIFSGDEAGNGFAMNFSSHAAFINTGGDIAWDTGTSHTFSYTNPIISGQDVAINFGGALFDVNGTIPSSASFDQTRVFSGNPLPFGGTALTGGSCITSTTNSCASAYLGVGSSPITGGTTNQIPFNNGGTLGEITKCNNGVYQTNGSGVPSCGTAPIAAGGTGITSGSSFITGPVITVDFSVAGDTAIPAPLPSGYTQLGSAQVFIAGATANISTATFGVFTLTGGGGTALVSAGTAVTVTNNTANTAQNYQQVNANNNSVTAYTPSSGAVQFRVGTTVAGTAKVFLGYRPVP